MRRKSWLLSLAVALPALAAAQSTDQWIGGTSNWNNPNNWNPAAVPGAGDTVNITDSDGVSRTVSYDYSGPALSLKSLNLDLTGGSAGALNTLSIPANNLSVTTGETIGITGAAAVVQSGGTNVTGSLMLGNRAGSTGSYVLSGTGALTAHNENIGNSGTGVFNQSGGSNSSQSEMNVSYLSGSGTYYQSGGVNGPGSLAIGYYASGSYVFSGGTLQTVNVYVGDGGYGTFNQSGGTATVTNIYVGSVPSNGTQAPSAYNLSAGNLIVSEQEYVDAGNSPALFTQSGGINSAADFSLGAATYTMTSGSLVAGTEDLGSSIGPAAFSQSGGTNAVAGNLYLNSEAGGGATVTYTLSGSGALTAVNEYIGYHGPGDFVQNGGSNTISPASQGGNSDLYIGYDAPGSYTLTAGTLTVPIEYVGLGDAGSFNQTGGSNTVGSVFIMAYNGGVTCTYVLIGGSLAAPTEEIGEEGRIFFNQSGGTNTVSGTLYLTYYGGTTTYTLTGGSVSVAGEEVIGMGGVGAFVQSGGTNVAAEIDVGPTFRASSYILTGGAAQVAGDLDVDGPNSDVLASGILTMSNTASLSVAGTLRVYRGGIANINGGSTTIGALAISTGGIVNINSAIAIDYGLVSPIASIVSYLQSGYAGGKWNGSYIVSTSVAALEASQTNLVYSLGYADGADGLTAVPSGEIEILPTIAGDATLQGTVNFGDFQLLAEYFGQANTSWDEGDFKYNGSTDIGDFQLLAQDFSSNSSALTATELSSLNSFAAQFGDTLLPNPDGAGFQIVSVPEPSAAAFAVGGLALFRRKRRVTVDAPASA